MHHPDGNTLCETLICLLASIFIEQSVYEICLFLAHGRCHAGSASGTELLLRQHPKGVHAKHLMVVFMLSCL